MTFSNVEVTVKERDSVMKSMKIIVYVLLCRIFWMEKMFVLERDIHIHSSCWVSQVQIESSRIPVAISVANSVGT